MLKDGWLYTGDIGYLDEAGHLKITDRKKDIIVTAGGKNVAPQNLENELKTDPLISQVMVHGDKRKFLSALVTLNEENARKWASDNGVPAGAALHEDPRVRAQIQKAIDALNAKQSSYSTIKRFAIVPRDFTQEIGRADADAQGQAQGRHAELQGPPRLVLRGVAGASPTGARAPVGPSALLARPRASATLQPKEARWTRAACASSSSRTTTTTGS